MACGWLTLSSLLLPALVAACGEAREFQHPTPGRSDAGFETAPNADDAGKDTPSDAAVTGSIPCHERSITRCVAGGGECYLIEARPVDVENRCVGSFAPAACESVDIMGGGAVPECLVSPTDQTWWFAGGVTLVGWNESTAFATSGECASLPLCGDERSTQCQERSIADCVADDDECVLIAAWPIDVDNRCIGERVPVGCASIGTGGDDVVLCSVSPTGEPWLFGSSLMPPGFTPSPDFPSASAECSGLPPCGDGGV